MSESCRRTDKKKEIGWEKQQEARCISDIRQFNENVQEAIDAGANSEVVDVAKRYCADTQFFLDKKDYVTAFGAINYAHGLIDAFRKFKGEKEKK